MIFWRTGGNYALKSFDWGSQVQAFPIKITFYISFDVLIFRKPGMSS